MKKFLALLLSAVMAMGVLAGCGGDSGSSSTADTGNSSSTADSGSSSTADSGDSGDSGEARLYGYMSKGAGSIFNDHMYYGFSTAIKALDPNGETTDRSPTEQGAPAQLTGMDELLTLGVDGFCMATFADTGFDEMNARYRDAGIPIVSIDSRVSDDTRVAHFNQCDSELMGRYYLWTSILATQKFDITDDTDVEAEAKKIVENHTGDPIVVGLISATPDSPVQLAWHYGIDGELEDPMYDGKVVQEIKYGMDDRVTAANQLNAFLADGKADVVFCMSAFSESVCQAAKESNATIPVIGLAVCSNIYDFLPTEDQDPYEAVAPFALLWDLQLQGYVAAHGLYYAMEGEYDGSVGSTFTTLAVDRFEALEYKTIDCAADDGTEVICGPPLIFTKHNKDVWVDRV